MGTWLRSRKFKLTLGAVLAAVAGGVTGQMTWGQVIWAVVLAFTANGLGIAIEDAGKKSAGK
jgi:hypothetical protein